MPIHVRSMREPPGVDAKRIHAVHYAAGAEEMQLESDENGLEARREDGILQGWNHVWVCEHHGGLYDPEIIHAREI